MSPPIRRAAASATQVSEQMRGPDRRPALWRADCGSELRAWLESPADCIAVEPTSLVSIFGPNTPRQGPGLMRMSDRPTSPAWWVGNPFGGDRYVHCPNG
jgi:hypothetical protein